MFKTGSFASRSSRNDSLGTTNASMYDTSDANDSIEDMRQELERQEADADGMENVRACCDGELTIIFCVGNILGSG